MAPPLHSSASHFLKRNLFDHLLIYFRVRQVYPGVSTKNSETRRVSMSIQRFNIRFDEHHATYISGRPLTGQVVILLEREKKIRAIEMKLSGEGKVHWTEGSGDDSTSYSAREVYLKNYICLVGGPGAEITLPPGEHVYLFKFLLPPNLPSSFEGVHGHVRYVVSAAVCRPWRFDHKCKAACTVINPLDLNTEPNVQEPAHFATEKHLCCGCFGSPITTVLSLPFRGFVPGQTCHATVEVDNGSDETVSAKLRLAQAVTFIATGGRKNVSKKVVAKEHLGVVNAGGSLSTLARLKIPVLPNSHLRNCKYIDISYKIELVGVVSGLHRNACASIPVVIGSIPLRTQFSFLEPSPAAYDRAALPENSREGGAVGLYEDNPPPYTDAFGSYPQMSPPAYEAYETAKTTIRTEEDNEFIHGNMEFTPRYPVYHFK